MATERIDIIVSTNGTAQKAAADIDSVAHSAKSTASALGLMRAALVAIATFEIAKRFLELADVFTQMQNRLRILTGDIATLNLVTRGLIAVSEQTGTSLESNSLLFTRLSRAVGGLGFTFGEVLKVTREVAEAILISGANSVQAKQGLLQLAEGLGSGVLRGRQLRSVVTDFPALADIIAKGFKGAGNAATLLGFALANPNILKTPQVFKALIAGADEIHRQFQTTTFTIAQGFERINIAITVFLGNVINATPVGKILTGVLQSISENIDLIITGLAALAVIVALNVLIAQFLSFGSTILSIVGFLTAFGVSLGASIIILTALGVTAAYFLSGNEYAFRDWSATVIAYIKTVLQNLNDIPTLIGVISTKLGRGFWNDVNHTLNHPFGIAALDKFVGLGGDPTTGQDKNFVNLGQQIPNTKAEVNFDNQFAANKAAILNGGVSRDRQDIVQNGITDQIRTALGFKQDFVNVDELIKELTKNIGKTGDKADETAAKIKGLKPALNLVGSVEPLLKFNVEMDQLKIDIALAADELKRMGIDGEDAFNRLAEKAAGFGPRVAELAEQAQVAIQQFQASQQHGYKGGPLSASSLEANILAIGGATDLQAVEKMKTDLAFLKGQFDSTAISAQHYGEAVRAVTGTSTEEDKFNAALLRVNASLLSEADKMTILRGILGETTPYDTYEAELKKITLAQDKAGLSAEEAAKKIRDNRITFLNTQTDLNSGIERTFLIMQKNSEDVASQIQTVLTDAFQGATDALVAFVNTGKLDFSSLISSIEADLLKLAANAIFSQLFGGLLKIPGSSGSSNNLIGNIFGSIIPGLFGGGGSVVQGASFGTGLGRLASGGSFEVGTGSSLGTIGGSIDNRLIAFRAMDGERVTVTPKGGRVGSGNTIYMTVNTPDANSFRASQSQILADMHRGLARADRRNN